jgi:hypothetical protein
LNLRIFATGGKIKFLGSVAWNGPFETKNVRNLDFKAKTAAQNFTDDSANSQFKFEFKNFFNSAGI